MITDDLFKNDSELNQIRLGEGTLLIRHFIASYASEIIKELEKITKQAPFRKMLTPNGHKMSVAMTNCGEIGWITDLKGYHYTQQDPITQRKWPDMPNLFRELALQAANFAGYPNFKPDGCLINRYLVGSKLSLHQDKDEKNLKAPIVSFSLGIPATFQWGGLKRTDRLEKLILSHGDVLVWGGVDRLRFHGILPIKANTHQTLGAQRINITFRQFY
ncbi:DNA oxidative demethylase AlkB [Entomomonas asaccharolytica]|nr:DNA oxidative demethylase AlkB [Entomomonas asaccharolytica]